MKQDKKTYFERVAETYREGSMLNRFYLFLSKKKQKGGQKINGKKEIR